MINLILLFLQTGATNTSWPTGWTIIGWVVAAVVAIVYLFSGVLQQLSLGRKDLLDVSDRKMANLAKERDELQFRINELNTRLDNAEKEKIDIEKDKTLLMREHHQLLEISVADLKTLKNNARLIEQLQDEVNRYRIEKGLPPRSDFTPPVRDE